MLVPSPISRDLPPAPAVRGKDASRVRESGRLSSRVRLAFAPFLLLASTGQAVASVAHDCTLNSSDLMCRLSSILHALYVVATVLALLLLIVVLVAVRLYRRNKADRNAAS